MVGYRVCCWFLVETPKCCCFGVGVEGHFDVQMVLHNLALKVWYLNYALRLEWVVGMGVASFVKFEYLCWNYSYFD